MKPEKSSIKLDLTDKKTVKKLKRSFKNLKELSVLTGKVANIKTKSPVYLRCHCCDFDCKLNVDIDSGETKWIKLSSFRVKESNIIQLSDKNYNTRYPDKTEKRPNEIIIDLYWCPVCGNVEAFSRYCLELIPQSSEDVENLKNNTF
jgi:hypothetical protein